MLPHYLAYQPDFFTMVPFSISPQVCLIWQQHAIHASALRRTPHDPPTAPLPHCLALLPFDTIKQLCWTLDQALQDAGRLHSATTYLRPHHHPCAVDMPCPCTRCPTPHASLPPYYSFCRHRALSADGTTLPACGRPHLRASLLVDGCAARALRAVLGSLAARDAACKRTRSYLVPLLPRTAERRVALTACWTRHNTTNNVPAAALRRFAVRCDVCIPL